MAFFGAEESRHCIRTLRNREGDEIRFTDGKGNLFHGNIEDPDLYRMSAKAFSETKMKRRAFTLAVALAIPKNPDRFEWFVEKSTELGIHSIVPLITDRTEKKNINLARIQKIAISALKQSQQYYLPEIYCPIPISDLSEKFSAWPMGIAYCNGNERLSLYEFAGKNPKALIIIGPEGDFSENEMNILSALPLSKVLSFGNGILRTETAGVYAASAYRLLFCND